MLLFVQTEHGNVPEHRSFLSLQKSQARETLGSFRRLPDSSSRAACPAAESVVVSEVTVVEWDSREGRRFLERDLVVVVVAVEALAGEVWDMEADPRAPIPCALPGLSMLNQ